VRQDPADVEGQGRIALPYPQSWSTPVGPFMRMDGWNYGNSHCLAILPSSFGNAGSRSYFTLGYSSYCT